MYETYQDHPRQAKGSIRVVLAVAFLACAIGAGIFLYHPSGQQATGQGRRSRSNRHRI